MNLPPVNTGGYVAAPVKEWLFPDHVQSISGTLICLWWSILHCLLFTVYWITVHKMEQLNKFPQTPTRVTAAATALVMAALSAEIGRAHV